MSREFPVAVGRADGETATMGVDNCAGVIRTNGERPDRLSAAQAITLVADILWLQRRLARLACIGTELPGRLFRKKALKV